MSKEIIAALPELTKIETQKIDDSKIIKIDEPEKYMLSHSYEFINDVTANVEFSLNSNYPIPLLFWMKRQNSLEHL